jgi:mannose-6-phosphate isomerase-like protein (cupin superfamily)
MSMRPKIKSAAAAAEYFTDERCHILELSNSTDDPDVSIARARVEPGVTTKQHRVSGTIERYVILEGTGQVEVEGMQSQSVGVGDVVVIPAGSAQAIKNTGSNDLVFLCICNPRFVWENYVSLE